jgi:hypothetical protein
MFVNLAPVPVPISTTASAAQAHADAAPARGARRWQPALRHALLATALAALTACGGGGSSDDTAAASLTGTAASGAPVVGHVTVKDSAGRTRTSPIEANGQYTVSVTGMTAPFLLMAEGTVGGRTVRLVSAATADDVNQTINITPFTDLIVANIAGAAAANYYDDDAPDFAKLSTAELNAAKQSLTDTLLPILRNLGVADSFDLLRSSFAADHSGFDAVMDVLRVSTDATARTAAIINVVDNTRVTDDLASKTDAVAFVTPAVALGDTVASLKAIEQTLAVITAAFKDGIPASNNAALRARMASNFVDQGGGVDAYLSSDGLLIPKFVGVVQSGATIRSIADGGSTINVGYETRLKDGTSSQWVHQFRRGADGTTWQDAGDRALFYAEIRAINARYPDNDGAYRSAYFPNLSFWIFSRHATAAYALLSGPGIQPSAPAALAGKGFNGAVLQRNGMTYRGENIFGALTANWLPDCEKQGRWELACMVPSQVSAGGAYTFTLLDANGAAIGQPRTVTLAEAPLSPTQSAAAGDALFPRIAAIRPNAAAALLDGTLVSMTVALPTAGQSHFQAAAMYDTPSGGGLFASSFNGNNVDVGVWVGAAPTGSVGVSVTARNAQGSDFYTYGRLN